MPSFVIDYFELPTTAMEKSSAFFKKAFGWGNKPYGPDYAEIVDAGVLGGINGSDEGRSDAPVVGIRTDDIEGAQAAVEKAGGTISIAPRDYPGGRRFFFREPGGAELMVYEVRE